MERRAVVYRICGDEAIAGAIVDGMTKNAIPLNAQELACVTEHYNRLQMREEVRKYRMERDWGKVKRRMDRRYCVPQHNLVYEYALIAWALTWLFLIECYRRMSAWNRR